MKFIFSLLVMALLSVHSVRAEEPSSYCSFETLPPMSVFSRGGMGASDNTLIIGNSAPVPLSIGSGLMLATFEENEFTISGRSVTVRKTDGSTVWFTRSGVCSLTDDIFSLNQDMDTKTALEVGYQWRDVNVCKAAVETYFFLNDSPVFQGEAGGIHFFESNSGNVYKCSIRGRVTEFNWFNQQGDAMNSQSTTYSFVGTDLVISTDMLSKTFEFPR